MTYNDGETVQLGDRVEVNDAPEEFEPEEAIIIKLGKVKVQIEYVNTHITNRKAWVETKHCEMIFREY